MNHTELKETLSHYIPEDSVLNEILNIIPHWIPIDEAELVSGDIYDIFVPVSSRQRLCNAIYTPEHELFDLISGHAVPVSEVTHIMKHPAYPEI